jgi:hypothetical protein
MIREPGALGRPAPARSASCPIAPVLIQVPALPCSARGRRSSRPVRRRRRLRREVRIAGSALLLGLPLAAAALMLGGARSSALTPDEGPTRPATAGAEGPPVVSIAMPIDPEPPASVRESVPPVQLPDYVLPDDGSEEATHAGS